MDDETKGPELVLVGPNEEVKPDTWFIGVMPSGYPRLLRGLPLYERRPYELDDADDYYRPADFRVLYEIKGEL